MSATLLSMEDVRQFENASFFQNAVVSDLPVVQGVQPNKSDSACVSTSPYWLTDSQTNLCVIHQQNGKIRTVNPTVDTIASVRPVLPLSQIPHAAIMKTKRSYQENNQTYTLVKYGHYPQTIIDDEELIETLDIMRSRAATYEGEYKKGRAGMYTFDKNALENKDPRFRSLLNEVFELDGERYICMTGKQYVFWQQNDKSLVVQTGKNYWLKVEPIEWIIHPKKNQAVSLKGLFSGMVFDESGMYDGCFEKTQMYRYLNDYFYPEMLQFQEDSFNIHSMTEFKEALIACFSEETLQQYQNNRLGFYLSVLKIAKETSEMSCFDGTLKQDMVIYAKKLVSMMTRDETITPQKALQHVQLEVANERVSIQSPKLRHSWQKEYE